MMTENQLHSKIETIAKKSKISTWLEVLTILSIVIGFTLYFTSNHEVSAVNNVEIRAQIKESNEDLTNKMNTIYGALNNKIDIKDYKDSLRILVLTTVMNSNHDITESKLLYNAEKINRIEDYLKKKECCKVSGVIEKHTNTGLIVTPYKP